MIHQLANSVQIKKFVSAQDTKLNQRMGYTADGVANGLTALLTFGRVEIGWRESCGSTDPTMHTYRAWAKLVQRLKKLGAIIQEERVKHANAYATSKGGFWNSIIYSLPKPDRSAQDRIEWENDVYEAMTIQMDVTRSDAQSASDAVPDAMDAAWAQGMTPEAGAQFIRKANEDAAR